MIDLEQVFAEQGGVFCISAEEFRDKTQKIKAYIFDWDGVFNDGTKDHEGSSVFSEVDAMGTNLLRFSHFLDKKMPVTAIMSGEKNSLSFHLGTREHFHSVYFKVKNKLQAFEHFLTTWGLASDEVAFFFDDVLDLGISEQCGLRLLVNQKANPLFRNYVVRNNLADYLTANPGGSFAVRELCELIMGARGNFDIVVQQRSHFSSQYETYLTERQLLQTQFYTWNGESILETKI